MDLDTAIIQGELLTIRLILYMGIMIVSFVLLDRFLREPGWMLAAIITVVLFVDMVRRILRMTPSGSKRSPK